MMDLHCEMEMLNEMKLLFHSLVTKCYLNKSMELKP